MIRVRLTVREDGTCWGCCFEPPRPVQSAVLWQEGDGWHGLGVCRFCFGTIQAERAANSAGRDTRGSRPIGPRSGDTH